VWEHPASAASKVVGARKKPVVTSIKSIKNVRSVYVRSLKGDQVFARRLMAEMRDMGLRFMNQRARADAVFEAEGEYSQGTFYGVMKFYDLKGKLIWQTRAMRPRGNNYMAYSRLADKLRAALGKR
jgi:hypothetical protein